MKEIFKGITALFFFKPYTSMSRTLEICYGITAWGLLSIIVYSCIK